MDWYHLGSVHSDLKVTNQHKKELNYSFLTSTTQKSAKKNPLLGFDEMLESN